MFDFFTIQVDASVYTVRELCIYPITPLLHTPYLPGSPLTEILNIGYLI